MVNLLLEHCCCTVDLRRGVDTIFIFQIVSSILSIILMIVPGHGDKIGPFSQDPTLIGGILLFFACVIALYGLYKEIPYLLLPWMFVIIGLMIAAMIACYGAIYYPDDFKTTLYDIPMIVITTVIALYFLFCVFSLFVKLLRHDYKPTNDVDGENECIDINNH